MALMKEAIMDHRYGRYVNSKLADYYVLVNAYVAEIEEIFINKPATHILIPRALKGLE